MTPKDSEAKKPLTEADDSPKESLLKRRPWLFQLAGIASIYGGIRYYQSRSLLSKGAKLTPLRIRHKDGRTLNIPSKNGQRQIIYFWATWCPACRDSLKSLQSEYEKLGDDVELVTITVQSKSPEVEAIMTDQKLTFPVFEGDEMMFQQFRIEQLPTRYELSPNGEVQYASTGVTPWARAMGCFSRFS